MEGIGRPQLGYNPEVHGPYHPGRWYGKPDTKFADVKLAEVPAWLARRSKNPVDWLRAVSRGYWRWHLNWLSVKRPGAAPIVHLAAGMSIFYYFLQYKSHKTYISLYYWQMYMAKFVWPLSQAYMVEDYLKMSEESLLGYSFFLTKAADWGKTDSRKTGYVLK